MSYLKSYRTPAACHKKAPVRKQSLFEYRLMSLRAFNHDRRQIAKALKK